jgi:hypothetical protein
MARHTCSCREKKVRPKGIPMFSSCVARVPLTRTCIRRNWDTVLRRFRRWRKRARWMRRKLNAAPTALRIVVIATAMVAIFFATNLVYHVVHKPTDVFSPVNGAFNKLPAETWRQYAPLFREYSTTSISPELLAALAQVESAGNPVASTYWRWRKAIALSTIPSLRMAARRMASILEWCRVAPLSLPRSSWTAISRRFSGLGEPRRSARSGRRS